MDIGNELKAIYNSLNINPKNICAIGVFQQDNLIAYSINEILNSNYAIAHFYKAVMYNGLFDYLMEESSKFLLKFGSKSFNFEQDLGIQGLRKSKLSFKPSSFLKKYTVILKK